MNTNPTAPVHSETPPLEVWVLTEHFSDAPSDVSVFASRDDLCEHITARVLDGHDYQEWLTITSDEAGLPAHPQVADFSREQRAAMTDRFLSFWSPEISVEAVTVQASVRFGDSALHPAGLPDVGDSDYDGAEYSTLVAESSVYAHQSSIGDDVLNVEIDAAAGVTVRVHVNGGKVYEAEVPE